MNAQGVSEIEANLLTEKFLSHIGQLIQSQEYLNREGIDSYTLIERTLIERILDEHDIRTAICDSDSCAIEFGRILEAERVIIGTVGKIGETYSVSARIIDVEKAIMLRTADRQHRGSIDEVINSVVTEVGNELLLGPPEKSRKMWYILAGVVVAAGAGAALLGSGDDGGRAMLPQPPDNP